MNCGHAAESHCRARATLRANVKKKISAWAERCRKIQLAKSLVLPSERRPKFPLEDFCGRSAFGQSRFFPPETDVCVKKKT
jgi:hypothetical protein